MNIKELIAKGNTKEAIQVLIDNNSNEALLLMGRYSNIKERSMLGTIPYSEYILEINRINNSVLMLAGNMNPVIVATDTTAEITIRGDFNENYLLSVVNHNKRRRPEIAKEAQDIINDYREWKDKKSVTITYDPANRRLRVFQERVMGLVKKLKEEKEISLENIVERITKLLETPIPEYSDLKEAYTLASGRGFSSEWIEKQLIEQPKDDEVRITIAEKIEEFTTLISAH